MGFDVRSVPAQKAGVAENPSTLRVKDGPKKKLNEVPSHYSAASYV